MRKDMLINMQNIEYRTSDLERQISNMVHSNIATSSLVDDFTHWTYLFHRVAMFILVLVLCDIRTRYLL